MRVCPNCQAQLEDGFKFCPYCPDGPPKHQTAATKAITVSFEEPRKYPALRFISTTYKVMAVITLIVTLFLVAAGPLLGIPALVIGVIVSLTLLAFSEIIKIFIDIEENTRQKNQ